MIRIGTVLLALAYFAGAHPHGEHEEPEQASFVGPTISTEGWLQKYGAQNDLGYTGPLSFAHLEYARCLEKSDPTFDIAVLGMPCVASFGLVHGVCSSMCSQLRYDSIIPPWRSLWAHRYPCWQQAAHAARLHP